MEQGTWFFILKFLPYVAFCSIIAFLLGLWFARPKTATVTTPHTSSKSHADEAGPMKKLQEKYHQAEAEIRGLRQEISQIKSASVSAKEHQILKSEVETLHTHLETEKKRTASLEADLRKSQDISATLNSRLNNEAKSQSSRVIALENELSKAREALQSANGSFSSISDDEIRVELERAKETATNAIRLVGEARKRESALQQELETLKNQREKNPEKVGPIREASSAKNTVDIVVKPSPVQRAMEQVRLLNEKREAELAATESTASIPENADSQKESESTPVDASPAHDETSVVAAPQTEPENPLSPQAV